MSYDYRKLSEGMATGGGKHPKQVSIKMYGCVYPASENLIKHNRDNTFYSHIKTALNINICYGQFKKNSGVLVEKGVDVRLATDLIMDAVHQNYDQAYIFSSDTDLIPAIEAVTKNFGSKKIFVFLNLKMSHLWSEFKKAGAFPINLTEKVLREHCGDHKIVPSTESLIDLQCKFKK
jgi:hypothetical protein